MPQAVHHYLEAEMEGVETHRFGWGEAVVLSARGPHKDSPNEDAAALIDVDGARLVLAIADGVGGGPAGAAASGAALRALGTALGGAEPEADLRVPILDGIERANEAVIRLGIGAGTTLAVVEVRERWLRPYHVGDSAILLVGQRGKLKLLTVPHSPVGYAVEAGLIDDREAMHHEDRHLISNMVGTPDMRIEVGPVIDFAQRDTLLLGSDGLFDNLHVEEIVQLVRAGPLVRVAEQLHHACQQRMVQPLEGHPSKPDDLSFILFRQRARLRGRRSAVPDRG